MNQIEVNWNCSNFAVALEAKVTDEQLLALAPYGMKYLAQRAKIDRALGIQVKEGDKWVSTGVKRGDVPFSAEKAEALVELFSELKGEGEDALSISCAAVVGEYEREKAESKWKAEREKIASKGGDAEKLKAMAKVVGYTGEDFTVDSVEFCAAIRAWVKAQLAAV